MNKLPIVKATFYIAGDEFDIDDVTTRMKIIPTKEMKKSDFPACGLPHTEWVFKIEEEHADCIENTFNKIMAVLIGKEKMISQICTDYNAEVGIVITIYMKKNKRPLLDLSREMISFAASINAEIGFDLYID